MCLPKASDSYTSNVQSASFPFTNSAQDPTGLSANADGIARTESDGVARLPTLSSQPHIARPYPSIPGSLSDESWAFDSDPQIPAWFAGEDFDISALNTEILMSTANWIPSETGIQYQVESLSETDRLLGEDLLPSRQEQVRTHWFTFTGASRTGHITPEMGVEQTQVDDAYRASLAVKLQPHVPVLPLPSTDFLVSCWTFTGGFIVS